MGLNRGLSLGWCCLRGSWYVESRGSLCLIQDTLLHKMPALAKLAVETDESFSVGQEWKVCLGGYHRGQLRKE